MSKGTLSVFEFYEEERMSCILEMLNGKSRNLKVPVVDIRENPAVNQEVDDKKISKYLTVS